MKMARLTEKSLPKKHFLLKKIHNFSTKITHPYIVELTKQRIAEYFASGCNIVVFDAPQLFESGSDKLCDIIVSVIASQECRLARIISRDGVSREQALSRMKVQLSEEYFLEHSDYILNGEQNIDNLINDAEALIKMVKDGSFISKKGSGK